ncbi:transglutaminase-like domain-containing protein [Mangrovicoccus ximenensis]|uniref:transglutaminase-like domain-containing protein n=1 Tax=Mangrovicoccus ximenensis TaxID=1911570 RepID=UPI000D386ABF|nr:transglutaminase family protein [Mangrovicoccus ximenensis]
MKIGIDVAMDYELGEECVVFLTLEAADTDGQHVLESRLDIEGALLSRIPGESGIGTRVVARLDSPLMRLAYRAEVEITRQDRPLAEMDATPWHDLPAEAMTYLRPSRFCQSDVFETFARRRFGDLEGGAKVAAIRKWVADELSYVPGASTGTTTVVDTFTSRQGVCRDYAHMVCALCRAADIPARYVSVYAPDVDPPDFHAVAQVWLDDSWHIVDPTGMCRPESSVIVAVGRDAYDVAFMENRGNAQLLFQSVGVRAA